MRDGANAWPGRLGPALVWGVTLALFAALFALQDWARWQAAPATILGRIGMFAACHGLGVLSPARSRPGSSAGPGPRAGRWRFSAASP